MTQTAATAPVYSVTDLPGGERNLIGLARVSTDAQDAQLQRDALAAAGCGRIYEEKISTRKAASDRPGLTVALAELRSGDTLTVWKLDRLGRPTKEILTIADDLHAQGVGVKILTGKLSGTYSPSGEGKFFFTMMAAFAELERDIIHERTMAGLVAARAQGRGGGRPTVMDPDKLGAARARHARGESPTQIAKALGVSRASVYRHLSTAAADTGDAAS
ncbi:MAG: recombinase family protein [Streptosporangiaceae bacterium]